jgi:hypothetical protein
MAMHYKSDPRAIEYLFFEVMKKNSIAACKRGDKK